MKKVNQTDLLPLLLDKSKWESEDLNPNKGIFLLGNPGVGKTVGLTKWLNQTGTANKFIDSSNIELGVLTNAQEFYKSLEFVHCLVWDDLGQEPAHMLYMGSPTKPGSMITTMRYNCFPTFKTHATTNNTLEELQEKYGERVISRWKEMFNFIMVTGNDLRK